MLRSVGKATCVALLCIICAFTAGCADAVDAAAHAVVHVAAEKSGSKRFCAYELSVPTMAQTAVVDHYWTPLARSALRTISQGKMAVTVPKEHLTPPQRRALRLAEWAERAFLPRPRLVCLHIPARAAPSHAGAGAASTK